MTLPRSKSAPFPISSFTDVSDSPRVRTRTRSPKQTALPRSQTFVNASPRISSVYTPRIEKEDPFALSGFFSSANFGATTDEQEEWNWLRHEKAREGDDAFSGSASGENLSLPATPGGIMFSKFEDELAGEEIKGEDKLGVLSFQNPFSRALESGMDDRLYSPYTNDDEPVDHDALYNALCKRRQDHSRVTLRSAGAPTVSGELFSAGTEEREEDGWGTFVKAVGLYSIL